ncbi:hypothetical protein N7I30_19880 [Aurantimonas litoralis]|nr:hypothetical protein [Aurantimonas litoralis]
MNAGVKRFLAGVRSKISGNGTGRGTVTSDANAQIKLELDHLRKHFALLAAERGELLVKLQEATRTGGIAEHGRIRDVIAPFP